MDWIEVSSKRVSEVAFDVVEKKVFVKFKSDGVIYIYNGVSEDIFKQFITAVSIGSAIPLLGNNYHKLT